MKPRMPQIDMEQVRINFRSWMQWWAAEFPERAPTEAALAELLEMTPGGLNHIFSDKQRRIPSLKTLLRAAALTGLPVETLCYKPGPKPRPRLA